MLKAANGVIDWYKNRAYRTGYRHGKQTFHHQRLAPPMPRIAAKDDQLCVSYLTGFQAGVQDAEQGRAGEARSPLRISNT